MILYVVIPCYNEEAVLEETASRLLKKMKALTADHMIQENSKILFVNDGSQDRTWELIVKLHRENSQITGLSLSRNRGHQNALLAGLMTAKDYADAVISMDADLQDDIEVIGEMLEKYRSGSQIVYGVRKSRKKDSFWKRTTAEGYYHFMEHMGAEVVFNHADFRLMSKKALEALSRFSEVNLFLRGLVPMIGYSSDIVYYERKERFAGESKYPLKKMLSFAAEGITSLSTKPLKMISALGLFVFLFSFLILGYSLFRYFTGETIVGWTTIVMSIWAIGGLILLALGVIGEYIGKIYMETKNRPRYIIEQNLLEEDTGE